MVSKTHLRSATFILLLVMGSPALASGGSTLAWRKGSADIDQKLREKQWEAAEKQARKLADRMVREAGLGEGAFYALGVVSAFQAVAAAGLGREDEADWRWATALNLYPDLAKTDLRPYGLAAAGLKTRQVRFKDPASEVIDEPKKPEGEVQRPKVVRMVKPSFPEGLRQMRVTGTVVIESIIGEDGVPRHPLLLKRLGPAMEYVALEAVRQWRFEPALLDGRAVKVYYVLTIDFGFGL